MSDLSWILIGGLAATGMVMALLSSLVGMRQKVEIPLWWLNYALWVVVVLLLDAPSPFLTILVASLLAGLVHAITQGLLLPHYRRNNPWYAEKMQVPDGRLRLQFLLMGLLIGTAFGALVGGMAWGLTLFYN